MGEHKLRVYSILKERPFKAWSLELECEEDFMEVDLVLNIQGFLSPTTVVFLESSWERVKKAGYFCPEDNKSNRYRLMKGWV